MVWYLVFWRNRSTATVVSAASASQARCRAQRKQKRRYGAIVAAHGTRETGSARSARVTTAALLKLATA